MIRMATRFFGFSVSALFFLFFSIQANSEAFEGSTSKEVYEMYAECSKENDCSLYINELESRHESGDWDATLNFSYVFSYGSGSLVDREKGKQLLEKSAEAGLPRAMLRLAAHYENGVPSTIFDRNHDLAISWYRRAAHAGEGIAIARLIDAYEHGNLGVDKNSDSADYWKRVRADKKGPCPEDDE